MATDVSPMSDQSVTRLVSGIIDDAQELMRQQLQLLKVDVKKEIDDAKSAAGSFALAGVFGGLGALLLTFAAAHLLRWAVPDLPLWGAYGIVGLVLGVVGGALFFRAKHKLDTLTPLPEQSMEAMKENLQWKTKPN